MTPKVAASGARHGAPEHPGTVPGPIEEPDMTQVHDPRHNILFHPPIDADQQRRPRLGVRLDLVEDGVKILFPCHCICGAGCCPELEI